ncbi:hypothetical protein LEP1GSC202_0439 [Leptospira yanagawae serovar Saopaulo str. Sao Paulo = ATCC 700523]|uniref:Uncharacterized protein n=1 Tax=Leptospira yanagawae serovar Saopaulo str. Sao Paulo = ATCC 700523 TaxID=1249483 RepID=A0A5E8HHH3_9LEPT|nr:hypothetical protein LEP1GSC202_0439 [Leptospira yanagawae serovar Saopaulo str. Sao Paulo = ATCC 700523]
MKLDSKFLFLYKPELEDVGFLWAYRDSNFAFIKYFTMAELGKISKI